MRSVVSPLSTNLVCVCFTFASHQPYMSPKSLFFPVVIPICFEGTLVFQGKSTRSLCVLPSLKLTHSEKSWKRIFNQRFWKLHRPCIIIETESWNVPRLKNTAQGIVEMERAKASNLTLSSYNWLHQIYFRPPNAFFSRLPFCLVFSKLSLLNTRAQMSWISGDVIHSHFLYCKYVNSCTFSLLTSMWLPMAKESKELYKKPPTTSQICLGLRIPLIIAFMIFGGS